MTLVACWTTAFHGQQEKLIHLAFPDSERGLNGSVRSGLEVSDRLPSGTISPVKENDPLGALDDNDRTITNLVDANNLLNKKHMMESMTSTPEKDRRSESDRKRSRIEDYFNGSIDALFGISAYNRTARERSLKPDFDQVCINATPAPKSWLRVSSKLIL